MGKIANNIPRMDSLAEKAQDSIRKAVRMIDNMKKPE
jgi:hypothetical protein